MSNHKLYFAIYFLMYLSQTYTQDDFYAKFHQTDYKLDFQRLILVNYSKSVFNLVEIKTFKFNRTLPAVNITINSKIKIGDKLELTVQFYKFLSNEYRRLRGTNFQVNYCRSSKTNIMGIHNLYKCGNFTACSFIPEVTYIICNAYPDESRFPAFLPNGEYKLEAQYLLYDEIIATIHIYIKIHRPIAIPKK